MSCEGCRATEQVRVMWATPKGREVRTHEKARCLCDTTDIEAFIQNPNDAAYWPVGDRRRIPVSDADGAFVIVTMADTLAETWAA